MTSPTEGWAFADGIYNLVRPQIPDTVAIRYEQGTWRAEVIHVEGATDGPRLVAFAATSPTQGWALGNHFVSTDIGGIVQGSLLYYDGGAWGVVRR